MIFSVAPVDRDKPDLNNHMNNDVGDAVVAEKEDGDQQQPSSSDSNKSDITVSSIGITVKLVTSVNEEKTNLNNHIISDTGDVVVAEKDNNEQ